MADNRFKFIAANVSAACESSADSDVAALVLNAVRDNSREVGQFLEESRYFTILFVS